SAHRKAASVLPDPVGASTSVWSPWLIAAQPSSCAGVGAGNVAANQRLVTSEKRSSAATRAGYAFGHGSRTAKWLVGPRTVNVNFAGRAQRGTGPGVPWAEWSCCVGTGDPCSAGPY